MNLVVEPPLRGLTRIRLSLAYDGSYFSGWAFQPNLRTVQGEVQKAIATALHIKDRIEVVVAGRTDAGVHARGQVIHSDVPELPEDFDFQKLVYSLNGILDTDVRFLSAEFAPPGFDARFSAIARRYSYAVMDGSTDPLLRSFAITHWRELNVESMNLASATLLGLHDFASFCKPNDYGSTIRTLQEFTWKREGLLLKATLQADAFCHSMVRALVGCVIAIGDGRQPVEFARAVLERRRRGADVVTMPSCGLTLEEVLYPADSDLLSRQEMTRAKRDISEVEG
jgi:tRNA pseudouridine38-40 synthase